MTASNDPNDSSLEYFDEPARISPEVSYDLEFETILRPPLRIWTALVVPIIAMVVGGIAAAVVIILGVLTASRTPLSPESIEQDVSQLLATPIGIWIAVLPGQLFFFGAAVAAAWLSPVALKQRLRLVRGDIPLWHWAVYVAAVPVIGIVTSLLLHATGAEWSDQMRQMSELMVAESSLDFAAILLLVAIVPGIAEEFLFRGYLQSRLLMRWRPATAICVSAAIFAIAHIDPVHVIAVFPLGIWLGLVAWRAGSVWPAVLCHVANNFLSVVSLQDTSDPLVLSSIETMLLLPSSLAFLGAVPLMLRKHAAAQPEKGTDAHTPAAT